MAGARRKPKKLTGVHRERQLRARFIRLLHHRTQSGMAAKMGWTRQRWRTYEGEGRPIPDGVKDELAMVTPGVDSNFFKDGNPRFLSMEYAALWRDFLASGGRLPPELDNGS